MTPATLPAIAVAITLSALPDDASLPGAGGEDSLLLAIVTDLTTRNASETARRRLMTQLISAETDERRRVARELHDGTGQSLTALLVGLRAIAHMSTRPEVQEAAMRLRDVAAQTIDDVSRLARGLHPAVLDDKGLGAAARRYVDDYMRLNGTRVEFTSGRVDTPRLPPLTAGTLYRIMQEALTNIARHADATKVKVKLTRASSTLGLVVIDNGVGFDVRSPKDDRSGIGLKSMDERISLLGGTLRIESRPGVGTEIHASLPVPPPRKPGRVTSAMQDHR